MAKRKVRTTTYQPARKNIAEGSKRKTLSLTTAKSPDVALGRRPRRRASSVLFAANSRKSAKLLRGAGGQVK